MSEPEVYQIDVNGKYILQLEEPLPAEEIERLARQMKE